MLQKSGEKTTVWMYKTLYLDGGINYQPQLVAAGFLNHQQYLFFLVFRPNPGHDVGMSTLKSLAIGVWWYMIYRLHPAIQLFSTVGNTIESLLLVGNLQINLHGIRCEDRRTVFWLDRVRLLWLRMHFQNCGTMTKPHPKNLAESSPLAGSGWHEEADQDLLRSNQLSWKGGNKTHLSWVWGYPPPKK